MKKNQLIKAIPIISIFVLLVFTFNWLIGQDKTELPSQLIDLPAPSFKVADLIDNNQIRTEDDFKGNITLVNVWASWCPQCYQEHPYWKQYKLNRDIVLVGLNYRDKRSKALKFLREQGDYFEWNLFDHDGRLGIDFGVYGAPETFLIDRDGKVRYRHVGVVNPQVYKTVFLPLIEKIKVGF